MLRILPVISPEAIADFKVCKWGALMAGLSPAPWVAKAFLVYSVQGLLRSSSK